MDIITIRESLNTLKVWNNVSNPVGFANAISINRDFDVSDLYVYELSSIPEAINNDAMFEFPDGETLDTATMLRLYSIHNRVIQADKSFPWEAFREENITRVGYEILNLYTTAELDDIEFNLAQPDDATWREIPEKMKSVDEPSTTKSYNHNIPITRIIVS